MSDAISEAAKAAVEEQREKEQAPKEDPRVKAFIDRNAALLNLTVQNAAKSVMPMLRDLRPEWWVKGGATHELVQRRMAGMVSQGIRGLLTTDEPFVSVAEDAIIADVYHGESGVIVKLGVDLSAVVCYGESQEKEDGEEVDDEGRGSVPEADEEGPGA